MNSPSNYNLHDSTTWQGRYNSNETSWADIKRMGMVILPITVLLFIASFYMIFFIFMKDIKWLTPSTNNIFSTIWVDIKLVIAISIPCIGAGVILRQLVKRVEVFFKHLYQPPEGTDIRNLMRLRLMGILPLPPPLDNFFTYPFILIQEPKPEQIPWSAKWIGGPAILVIYDGTALYLERGNRFSRIVGPGMPLPFLDRFERIKAVVDLKPRHETRTIQNFTKDGIPVKIDVSLVCQIIASDQVRAHADKLVYPFDPEEVRKAVERVTVKMDPKTKKLRESEWVENVWGRVQGTLGTYIAGHRMDELFLEGQVPPTHLLSAATAKRLIEDVNKRLVNEGTKVIEMQFPKIDVGDTVRNQRLNFWQAQKEKESISIEGQIEAKRLELQEQAHAEAQRDVMSIFIQSLEKVGTTHLIEPLLYSFSGFLDQNLEDPVIRAHVANESLDALEKLRLMLKQNF